VPGQGVLRLVVVVVEVEDALLHAGIIIEVDVEICPECTWQA